MRPTFNQFLSQKYQSLQQIIINNRIQRLLNIKYYYEHYSKRVQPKNMPKKFVKKDFSKIPEDPVLAKRRLLQLRTQQYRQKLILIRQYKIKRHTFIRTLIVDKMSKAHVYDNMMAFMRALFITVPQACGNFIVSLPVIRRIWATLRWNMAFIYRVLYGTYYYLRLLGLRLKFVWDTLNHYLLIKQLLSFAWREKFLTLLTLSYASYFLYFRPTYLIDPSRDYIWRQDFMHRQDVYIRTQVRKVLTEDVFKNEDLPAKIGPELVKLVQMPRIQKLMTDLFIILLKNKGFKDDVDRLIGKIIHDYLNSQDCKGKFETLIVEQVLYWVMRGLT
ncbi:hypothetical protein FGO68_gene1078 [Halteria grandinella]|uniref:Uncharacterized protein n=1 Tax=Halteria grandinella TaxID=5974 RepID=A0A8J8T8L5_HALGN|nr:hypothetical protein FGO68_gene1078 [Halteria grandinella]